MAPKASTTLSHQTVPRENSALSPRFVRMLSCRLDPLQTDGGMLAAHGTSHVNKSWSAGTSTLEADSTASLIDLTRPLTILNFLQHRCIAGHLQQTFLAPHRQSLPISPPGVTREWRAHCHIETSLCGNRKCPNLSTPFAGIK